MIDTLYVERDVADHPRTRRVLGRFPAATVIHCERYTEVFNPSSQSFRLQKRRPALVLARKFDGHVLAAPAGYGMGGARNYYFSHLMNCLYDCRYCFLQGMYRSAHYVLFVNFEAFEEAIDAAIEARDGDHPWFFSGYDCDSLALEPVTGFVEHFLPFFSSRPRGRFELRTKSTQIRRLLDREPVANVVVAFSLTPEEISERLEHGVPRLERRLHTMAELARRGWQIGLRFDPLIYWDGFESGYARLFRQVFDALPRDAIHSVSLGAFRLPRDFLRRMQRQHPDERLFAAVPERGQRVVSFGVERDRALMAFCHAELADRVEPGRIHHCEPPV